MNLNAIAEKFDVSRPAISQHIEILIECGIVEIEKKGRKRYCKIRSSSLIPVFMWIEPLQKQWKDKSDSFELYVNKLQSKNKKMSNTNDPKNRTLTIKKTFDAPVKLVWETWTHPEVLTLKGGKMALKSRK